MHAHPRRLALAALQEGRVSGGIYHGGDELSEVITQSYGLFCLANPLHPDLFPAVRKMEAEVVQMVVNMFNGDENACGAMTSGGTESILMACKVRHNRPSDLIAVCVA